mmetsp:Transcript_41583/g.125611  ORF Transcript_41583/g.125611 Transcript_41583/m.125611 type:complete len:232 (-) Transcript_41583:135-830(-)
MMSKYMAVLFMLRCQASHSKFRTATCKPNFRMDCNVPGFTMEIPYMSLLRSTNRRTSGWRCHAFIMVFLKKSAASVPVGQQRHTQKAIAATFTWLSSWRGAMATMPMSSTQRKIHARIPLGRGARSTSATQRNSWMRRARTACKPLPELRWASSSNIANMRLWRRYPKQRPSEAEYLIFKRSRFKGTRYSGMSSSRKVITVCRLVIGRPNPSFPLKSQAAPVGARSMSVST